MNFRKSNGPVQTHAEAQRQSRVIQCAWRHFCEPGPAISFLNTHHELLGARPIVLAIDSDDGLQRVERLLASLDCKISPIVPEARRHD
jgi:hypothetical protein